MEMSASQAPSAALPFSNASALTLVPPTKDFVNLKFFLKNVTQKEMFSSQRSLGKFHMI